MNIVRFGKYKYVAKKLQAMLILLKYDNHKHSGQQKHAIQFKNENSTEVAVPLKHCT